MTEAPFVPKLMRLGMEAGPALALLLTGPGLSLPNQLASARVFRGEKSFVPYPPWNSGGLVLRPAEVRGIRTNDISSCGGY